MHDERFRPAHQARVVEWIPDKGYGWLNWQGKRLFIHQRDIGSRRNFPKRGDLIEFVLGCDAQGRTCAVNAVNLSAVSTGWLASLLILPLMLALPVYALHRAGLEAWMLPIALTVPSSFTYMAYASDKRRARRGAWRISETTLHMLELLGGWPGAWLAQRRFGHKCSKTSYQLTFWAIVFLHQFMAVDSLNGWKRTYSMLTRVKGHFNRIFDQEAHERSHPSRASSPTQEPQRSHRNETRERLDDFR